MLIVWIEDGVEVHSTAKNLYFLFLSPMCHVKINNIQIVYILNIVFKYKAWLIMDQILLNIRYGFI